MTFWGRLFCVTFVVVFLPVEFFLANLAWWRKQVQIWIFILCVYALNPLK